LLVNSLPFPLFIAYNTVFASKFLGTTCQVKMQDKAALLFGFNKPATVPLGNLSNVAIVVVNPINTLILVHQKKA
jgi:hypothetical protein